MLFCLKPKITFRKWLRWGFLIFGLVVALGIFLSWQLLSPASQSDSLKLFSITSGESAGQISLDLKKASLIKSQFWFKTWVMLNGKENKFVAGEYYLPSNINLLNLVRLLTGAVEPINELSVRFIEGWTIKQMDDYLADNHIFKKGELIRFANSSSDFVKVLKNNSLVKKSATSSLEGYLFPDTYRIYRQSIIAELVVKMLDNFEQKFKPSWENELNKRGATVNQAVILASIVEREVTSEVDRAMVADIFWRRLQAGRGLEADSTINYITGKNNASASVKDLKIDSPYNTYKYRGLPPGPISNPGKGALRAVVYPQPNQYWYFLTTPQGQVVYSRTFDEHKQAKARYLK